VNALHRQIAATQKTAFVSKMTASANDHTVTRTRASQPFSKIVQPPAQQFAVAPRTTCSNRHPCARSAPTPKRARPICHPSVRSNRHPVTLVRYHSSGPTLYPPAFSRIPRLFPTRDHPVDVSPGLPKNGPLSGRASVQHVANSTTQWSLVDGTPTAGTTQWSALGGHPPRGHH
jgi:hypothetical protein